MIENIRKYTGLIIFFLALVIVSLVIGIKDDLFRGGGGGQPMLKIAGRTYSDRELSRLGSGAFDLASGLARSGDFGLYQFIMSLSSGATGQEDAAEKFFIGRMIIREAADEFGVHPGDEEISAYIRKLRAFAGPDGEFNEETYRNFIDRGLGRMGMTEADLRELAADAITTAKINEIVGTGLGVNRDVAALNLALDNQKVSGELARLDLTPYETAVEPTEEQIKEYWENIQDSFTTEPRRKFTYVIVTPDMPSEEAQGEAPATGDAAPETAEPTPESAPPAENAAQETEEETTEESADEAEQETEVTAPEAAEEPKEVPAEAPAGETPETNADAAKAAEEKETAEKKAAEEQAAKAAKLAEERRAKQLEVDKLVDDFSFRLEEQKGEGFEELAAENKWEVKTSELFARSSPPKELDLTLRSSSRGGKAVDELFRIEPTSDPLSKLSQPIAVGENQWLVARLDEEEKSRTKTYEEAKDEARAQYISEKATEAMKKAAEEALTKIKEALAAGKSFADAAKEAGIEETHSFNDAGRDYQPDPMSEPRTLFEVTRNVDPGALAEVVTEADRAFIVHVVKREVVKEENAASRIDGELTSRASENETLAFMGWIAARIEAANVQQLYKR